MNEIPLPKDPPVLIVGAGPTGLVLALWLTRFGIRVRIVDKTAEAGTTSRALAVQVRTLEFYNQIGLAEAMIAQGRKFGAVNLWVAGRKAARSAVFGTMGKDISAFPFALTYPQDEHERLLIDRLAAEGVEVERRTELVGIEDLGDRVRARLARANGAIETCEALYAAGCDGAHSFVRNALDIRFPGEAYAHLFYVADVMAGGPAVNGELHVALDSTDFLAVFPLQDEKRVRLVGTVRKPPEGTSEKLSWEDVSKKVIEWMRLDVGRVNWFSTYQVHHRVADRFGKGRVFLLGDAAHIHSPVGGQGMNTGIGDAVNLAWKLAAVLEGCASPSLLESYEPERIAFARRLVATTDRVFSFVTSQGALARWIRLKLAPVVFPLVLRLTAVQRFLFRSVSQTAVSYRGCRINAGRVGKICGGDRLPWVRTGGAEGEPSDNYAPLAALNWQVHIYGEASDEVRDWSAQTGVPLKVFPWRPSMRRAGLGRGAILLLRPDGHVGFAGWASAVPALRDYWQTRKFGPLQPPLSNSTPARPR